MSGAQGALQNFRDVGGLLTRSGAPVRTGVLYRSDAPRAGDAPPRRALWPPVTVIDLRAPEELVVEHPLGDRSVVHSIPLMRNAGITRLAGRPRRVEGGLERMYRETLGAVGPSLVRCARVIADADGATLVHCTAGKDRTGLLVAVVLSAVDVTREEVVADYARTQENMDRVISRIATTPGVPDAAALVERIAERQPELLAAPAEAMHALLDALDELGGAEEWLRRSGLGAGAMARLRERLLAG